jgi:hypothetical protein
MGSEYWKELFLQEQEKRKEEERRREAAESAREVEERRREAAESAREAEERKTRKTTLPELLHACHTHLHSGLTVQTDATQSTRGDPANAKDKLRPERLREWRDFPSQQAAIWDDLMDSRFISERYFTSIHTLAESGEAIRRRMMASELDLHLFQRSTVDEHIASVTERLHDEPALRRKFGLRGSVKFENHANTLSPESELEESMEQMTVSGTQRRRSPRLQAKAKNVQSTVSTDPTEPVAARREETSRPSRPRPDQFCVYNTSNNGSRSAAYILEYKAPHKLPLGYIYEGLQDMELEDVVQYREIDTSQDRFRRLIAAVITQAFSYMVAIGLEYGCVCTGEAYIFLRVPDDPRTVYYYLSVPSGDVGENTGWTSDPSRSNRLHLTAVGQMLAFTLQALKTPPRSQKWRANAVAQLNSWVVTYNDILDIIPLEDVPSSEYRPPSNDTFLRMSPIQLRQRVAPTSSPGCGEPSEHDEASDNEPDPDTPSRPPFSHSLITRTSAPTGSSPPSGDRRGGSQSGQYCTQKCLLGLVKGDLLDTSCPNVRCHGDIYHQINQRTLLDLVSQQLFEDMDTDCTPIGGPGACGVPFRIRLKSHGYTFAAKATPVDFVRRLKQEGAIYQHLYPIQGVHVPVYLGNVDLKMPYFFEGIAELVHMMFLSFGGELISKHITPNNRLPVTQQVDLSAQAIHDLQVLHKDLEPRNILWNEETKGVMVIDFERAEVLKPRTVLGVISSNRKRKRPSEASMAKQGGGDVFMQERRRAAFELRGLIGSPR